MIRICFDRNDVLQFFNIFEKESLLGIVMNDTSMASLDSIVFLGLLGHGPGGSYYMHTTTYIAIYMHGCVNK